MSLGLWELNRPRWNLSVVIQKYGDRNAKNSLFITIKPLMMWDLTPAVRRRFWESWWSSVLQFFFFFSFNSRQDHNTRNTELYQDVYVYTFLSVIFKITFALWASDMRPWSPNSTLQKNIKQNLLCRTLDLKQYRDTMVSVIPHQIHWFLYFLNQILMSGATTDWHSIMTGHERDTSHSQTGLGWGSPLEDITT